MSIPTAACAQCGASTVSGRIFCVNCGAGIQAPVSLLPPDPTPDDPTETASLLKRVIILITKTIGVIAALTFAFSPITTDIGMLLFGASIVVAFFCLAALSYLDDDFLKNHANEGYWPSSSFMGATARNDNKDEKRTDESIFQ